MNAKRKEFVDRLLRISQLNQELTQLDTKYKQPVFTRRINLVKMGKAELNLQMNNSPSPKRNCKILVIDKTTERYKSAQHNQNCSNRSEDSISEIEVFSPNKTQQKNIKSFFQRKKSIDQDFDSKNDDLKFISPANLAVKPLLAKQYERKRIRSAIKKTINSAKCIGVGNNSQTQDIQLSNREKWISGRSIKINNFQSRQRQNQTRREEQRKAKLQLMKQISKNYAKPFNPPPKISAKSYIVSEVIPQGTRVVVSFNSKNSQEVASLTKIMTCILTIQLCEQQKIDMENQKVKIGKYESNICGTTASLKPGQIYNLKQLLYGLMLPSGNDASLALAVWNGRKLIELESEQIKNSNQATQSSSINEYSPKVSKLSKATFYARFVRKMNEKAKQLNMTKTKYSNSHGLSNQNNKSTAYDISLLCNYTIKNLIFCEIVSCKSYQAVIQYQTKQSQLQVQRENQQLIFNDEYAFEQKTEKRNEQKSEGFQVKESNHDKLSQCFIKWENTHKLLQNKPEQYLGIKTGMTPTAGPCLSSLIKCQNRLFLIVVLGCNKKSLRFKQTEILKRWLFKHQGLNKKNKKQKNQLQSCMDDSCSASEEESKFELD